MARRFFIINKREKTARSICMVKNREKKNQTAMVRAREMGMKKIMYKEHR